MLTPRMRAVRMSATHPRPRVPTKFARGRHLRIPANISRLMTVSLPAKEVLAQQAFVRPDESPAGRPARGRHVAHQNRREGGGVGALVLDDGQVGFPILRPQPPSRPPPDPDGAPRCSSSPLRSLSHSPEQIEAGRQIPTAQILDCRTKTSKTHSHKSTG